MVFVLYMIRHSDFAISFIYKRPNKLQSFFAKNKFYFLFFRWLKISTFILLDWVTISSSWTNLVLFLFFGAVLLEIIFKNCNKCLVVNCISTCYKLQAYWFINTNVIKHQEVSQTSIIIFATYLVNSFIDLLKPFKICFFFHIKI